jgi:GTPase SAR1 family protein
VGPDIVITIAANKCDLEKERSVPDAVIAAYARQVGASYFNTSAKTGSGLDKAFQDIAKRALQQQQEKLASRSSTGSLGNPPPPLPLQTRKPDQKLYFFHPAHLNLYFVSKPGKKLGRKF